MKQAQHKGKDLVLRDLAQLRALGDPLRYQILEHLIGEAKTAKQVAEELGTKPTRLYHHFGVLERAGIIRKVRTHKVRGATEKYYQATANRMTVDPRLRSGSVVPVHPLYAAAFHSTLDEIATAVRSPAGAAGQLPILLNRLRIRTTAAAVVELQKQLDEWIASCEQANNANGDTEFGITVAFYQVPGDTPEESKQ